MFKFIKTIAIAALLLVSPMLWADALDINSDTADELAKGLAGIGPAKAQAIVQYREKNGPFKSVDDLTHVKGIGKATLEKNRAKVGVTGSTPAPAPAPGAAPPAVPPPAAAPGAPPAAPH
jgi:competence protein ComEA